MELGTLAETGNKVLSSRTLVNVLPPALLSVIVFVLIAAGAPDVPSAAELVMTLKDFGGAQVALLFLGVLVVALILQPFQIAVVQLLEGYWVGNPLSRFDRPSLAKKAFDIGVELQRRRYRFLRLLSEASEEEPSERSSNDAGDGADGRSDLVSSPLHTERAEWAGDELRLYPEEESRLMPTRLGNVLRSAEDRAGGRYGLMTNVVYPRLYSLLSDRLAAGIASSNDQLDMAAHLCVTLAASSLVSVALLLPNGWRSNVWWMAVPVASAVLCWLSYRAAIRAAESQSRLLETAFDLHRFDLLSALHYGLPGDPWSEYQFNSQLSRFLRGAQASTRVSELDGSVPPEDFLLAVDYEHHVGSAEDGSARRPSGPFQPFGWDWDAILGNGGGQPADDTGRAEQPERP
jgi:hypothetical protein